MLENLLKSVSPEVLATAIRNNPALVISTLQHTGVFVTIGQALSNTQQMCISNNINKLEEYFKTKEGKSSLSMMANEFAEFVKEK
jgi:hypothetical protein